MAGVHKLERNIRLCEGMPRSASRSVFFAGLDVGSNRVLHDDLRQIVQRSDPPKKRRGVRGRGKDRGTRGQRHGENAD